MVFCRPAGTTSRSFVILIIESYHIPLYSIRFTEVAGYCKTVVIVCGITGRRNRPEDVNPVNMCRVQILWIRFVLTGLCFWSLKSVSFEEDYAFACLVSWPFSSSARDPAVCRHSPTKHSFIHHARQPCWVALWTQWSDYNCVIQWCNTNIFLRYLQRWRNLRVIPCYVISHGVWHVAVPPQNTIPAFSLLWCQDQFWSQTASCTMALSVKVLAN